MSSPSRYVNTGRPNMRKRKERELSPAVPDPENITPDRRDSFWTPNRSARVFRTYAHKRARSYASSAPDEFDDDASSRSPSPQSSPIRPRGRSPPRTGGKVSIPLERIARRSTAASDHHDHPGEIEGPNHSTSSTAHGSNSTLQRRRSIVYVEVPQRAKGSRASSGKSRPTSRVRAGLSEHHDQRGRSSAQKAIAIPSPPPSDDVIGMPHLMRDFPTEALSLSEALNRSLAPSSSMDAGNVSPQRRRGRPRGRGGLVGLGPIISHDDMNRSPRREPQAAPAASISASPVKRGPGRPRKHPLPPGQPESVPRSVSRPRRAATRSRSRARPAGPTRDSDDVDAEVVAEQLLHDSSRSPERPGPSTSRRRSYAFQSIDIAPIVRAFERQEADEADILSGTETTSAPSAVSAKKPRGRPRGSKNKSTLAREAERAKRFAPLSAGPSRIPVQPFPTSVSTEASTFSLPPVPIKRGRGRPRKSAPSASNMLLEDTMDYMEPLKDPDENPPAARHSTPGPSRRGRSRTRRNSISTIPTAPAHTPGSPAGPSSYYLDLNTLQWKRRARSVSSSPVKRRASSRHGEHRANVTEYQTRVLLCTALKAALVSASARPKRGVYRAAGAVTEDGLKVAPSGILLFSDGEPSGGGNRRAEEEEGEEEDWQVFSGSWSVLEDPKVALDDALVLKKLHEVVLGIEAFIRLEDARTSRNPHDRTVTVAVPCCCQCVRPRSPRRASSSSRGAASVEDTDCAGELTVSISEEPAMGAYAGLAKVLRTTVTVTH
ncbi:hypothetical protein GY45DRAFT_1439244 [Cubamyces sp. BRFM 1775]|nr:hypothetical protein GY45DRAFT_1439244 [Cubamyces sp. BRFM 1775]